MNTCAFSSDWSKIVTGGDDMLVKLWDTKTGKVLFTLDSHEGKKMLPCNDLCSDVEHVCISDKKCLIHIMITILNNFLSLSQSML